MWCWNSFVRGHTEIKYRSRTNWNKSKNSRLLLPALPDMCYPRYAHSCSVHFYDNLELWLLKLSCAFVIADKKGPISKFTSWRKTNFWYLAVFQENGGIWMHRCWRMLLDNCWWTKLMWFRCSSKSDKNWIECQSCWDISIITFHYWLPLLNVLFEM